MKNTEKIRDKIIKRLREISCWTNYEISKKVEQIIEEELNLLIEEREGI